MAKEYFADRKANKKKKARKKKIGNAGCTKCGLRASSKNVMCRSVFACWPDDDRILQHLEASIGIKTDGDKQYVRVNPADGITQERAMAVWFKDVYDHDPANYEKNIQKVLCLHTWQQDRGTATV